MKKKMKKRKQTKKKIRKKIKKKIPKIKLKKRKVLIVSKKKNKKTLGLRKAVKIKFRPFIKAYDSFREKRVIKRLKEEKEKLIEKEKKLKEKEYVCVPTWTKKTILKKCLLLFQKKHTLGPTSI